VETTERGLTAFEARNPDRIRDLLLLDPYLHLYELGDLDPFFWPSTRWFVLDECVALLYTAAGSSVLICLTREPEPGRRLLQSIRDDLPDQVYSHLTPGLFDALEPRFEAVTFGQYQKMSLRGLGPTGPADRGEGSAGHADSAGRADSARHADAAGRADSAGRADPADRADLRQPVPHAPVVISLLPSDVDEVKEFYARAYPANWFDPRMLETGCYFGIRESGEVRAGRGADPSPRVGGDLLSVGGIHVYSPQERVGVLGNVATLPEARGRGLGTRVCRELCRKLAGEGLRIGLNVARENRAAIRCYASIGFVHEADYEERSIRIRRASPRVSE